MINMVSNRRMSFVTFYLENDEYGLDISQVLSIIDKPEIVKIPRSPDFIEGLINIRGEVLTVVNLRKKFKLPNAECEHIIIMKFKEKKFGVLVDKVSQTIHVEEKNLKKHLINGKIKNQYLDKVIIFEKKVIPILNLEKILPQFKT